MHELYQTVPPEKSNPILEHYFKDKPEPTPAQQRLMARMQAKG